jgi:hypothetical protein
LVIILVNVPKGVLGTVTVNSNYWKRVTNLIPA